MRKLIQAVAALAAFAASSGCVTGMLFEATVGQPSSPPRLARVDEVSIVGRDPESAVLHVRVAFADGRRREFHAREGVSAGPCGRAPLPRSNLVCLLCDEAPDEDGTARVAWFPDGRRRVDGHPMQALAPEDAADAAIVRARRPEDGGESSPWRLEVFFPPQDGWRAEGRNRELVLPARPDRVIVLEPPGATLGHELGEVAIFVVAAPVTLAADTAIGAGIVLMSSPQLADDVQRAMEHHPHHRRG